MIRKPFLPGPLLFVIAMAVASMLMFGCAASKYRTLYGITNAGYKAILTVDTEYKNADAEKKAWMEKDVHPYRNILHDALLALGALETGDDAKLSVAILGITETIAKTTIDYDPLPLITAIKTKDYDALEVQLILLKDKILEATGVI